MDNLTRELVKFEVLEKDQWSASAQVEISEKLPFFSGHFPNNPILPAVSIIDISLYFLNTQGFPFSYTQIAVRKSKFMGKVLPKQRVLISVAGNDSGEWLVSWTLLPSLTKLATIALSEIPSNKASVDV